MNILVLSNAPPSAPDKPGCPRLFSLASRLAERHRVSLLVPPTTRPSRIQSLQSQGVFESIEAMPFIGPPTLAGRLRHRLKRASSAEVRFHSKRAFLAARDTVWRSIDRFSPDVVLIRGLSVAELLLDYDTTPVVVDLVDSLSLLNARRGDRASAILERFAFASDARALQRFERRVCEAADAVIVISHVDADHLQSIGVRKDIAVVPNGVEDRWFNEPDQVNHPRLVFSGMMSYQPNADAARFLASEIFPRVQIVCPDAELWLVGMSPPEDILRLDGLRGVHVTGQVPDVQPFLQAGGVYVSPLRWGAGLKNKVLAAMASGLPVVGSPISFDGIPIQAGVNGVVASTASDFGEAIVSLFQDGAAARSVGRAGQMLVREKFQWDESTVALAEILQAAVNRASTAHRRRVDYLVSAGPG